MKKEEKVEIRSVNNLFGTTYSNSTDIPTQIAAVDACIRIITDSIAMSTLNYVDEDLNKVKRNPFKNTGYIVSKEI